MSANTKARLAWSAGRRTRFAGYQEAVSEEAAFGTKTAPRARSRGVSCPTEGV